MRALIHDPAAAAGLRLGDAPDPVPGPAQVLVEVAAISLNFGEVVSLSGQEPGYVSGWDAAGVVVRAAADGSGPAAGTRVVTFGWGGGWGRLRAVDVNELAAVPDAIDLGVAGAIPVAGVTALRALRALGPVAGRRVLVTGASGGVGRFAVQFAAQAGAHVIASVGGVARGEGLRELGADEVVVGLDSVTEPLSGVLDNVGGPQRAAAFALLADGGVIQAIGNASRQETVIDDADARGRRVEQFRVGDGMAPELAELLGLLAAGRLDVPIGWRGPWERAAEAAEDLIGRRIAGKAVLDVTG
jgi:NADPH:quinone reductase-like Zn-dependent oxidoreductase